MTLGAPNTGTELADLLAFATDLARRAGEVIMPYYQSVNTSFKADGSEVTEADIRAEEYMRADLERSQPGVAVLGEEFGGERTPQAGYQWVLDPVDGTQAFSVGSPLFGTLIGLLRDGEPVLGVIHMPALGETTYAAEGVGCHYARTGQDARRVRCEAVTQVKDAFVAASGVHGSEIEPLEAVPGYGLKPLIAAARRFRVVGDCYMHSLVARGAIDVGIDPIMAPWDIAALVPCIEEAGGAASSLSGERDKVVYSGSLVTAGTNALLDETLRLLSR